MMHLPQLRRRIVTSLADSFWLLAARAGRLHPNARPSRHRVEVIRDLRYAPGGTEHLLDVYRPSAGAGPWPALLYVHGGGFRVLSKDTHWVMGLAFARQGYVVFNISYRLAPAHPFPAALDDTIAACTWVLEHAREHGGDPSRLVLAGESAGANLIAAMTVAMCYRRDEPWARTAWELGLVPRAVLPACGLFQVSDVGRFARRRKLPGWLRENLAEVEEAYLGRSTVSHEAAALADPLLVLEEGAPPDRPLPPFFTVVGTRDPLLDDTRRLKAALDRLGVPCEARYYPGEMHAFQAFAWRPQARRAWRDTYAFLSRHVGDPGV
jgi:acetyl esterase